MDIAHGGAFPPIRVTEYDAMSRFFKLILLDNGTPYTPPQNAMYSVRYEVGLNSGWYDTITVPSGTDRGAVSVSGNEFTIEVAEDATHGCGTLALMILGDGGYQLTITGITLQSNYLTAESAGETQNYYNAIVATAQAAAATAQDAAATAVQYGALISVNSEQLVITHYTS